MSTLFTNAEIAISWTLLYNLCVLSLTNVGEDGTALYIYNLILCLFAPEIMLGKQVWLSLSFKQLPNKFTERAAMEILYKEFCWK